MDENDEDLLEGHRYLVSIEAKKCINHARLYTMS